MADLRLNEAALLKQALEDHGLRIALKSFFHHAAAENTGKAISYLTSYDEKSALEHAFIANWLNRGFNELEQFCKEQLAKAEA